jgi:hypothetical protein
MGITVEPKGRSGRHRSSSEFSLDQIIACWLGIVCGTRSKECKKKPDIGANGHFIRPENSIS